MENPYLRQEYISRINRVIDFSENNISKEMKFYDLADVVCFSKKTRLLKVKLARWPPLVESMLLVNLKLMWMNKEKRGTRFVRIGYLIAATNRMTGQRLNWD